MSEFSRFGAAADCGHDLELVALRDENKRLRRQVRTANIVAGVIIFVPPLLWLVSVLKG